jgi:hypothetical protein
MNFGVIAVLLLSAIHTGEAGKCIENEKQKKIDESTKKKKKKKKNEQKTRLTNQPPSISM